MYKITGAILLLYSFILPGTISADHLLKIEVQREIFDERTAALQRKPDLGEENLVSIFTEATRIWLGEKRVRVERTNNDTWILDAERGTVFHAHPDERSYDVFRLPLHLGAMLNSQQRGKLKELIASKKPEIRIEHSGATQSIDGWETYSLTLHAQSEVQQRTIRMWMAPNLGLDLGPYKDLIRFRGTLRPWNQEWAEKVADLEGFPVLWQMEERKGSLRVIETRRLVSIKKVTLDSEKYTPPTGWRKVENPFSEWLP